MKRLYVSMLGLILVCTSPRNGACGNPAFDDPSSVFFHARVGNLSAVAADLRSAPQLVNAIDNVGRTPLMYAAKAGHDSIVDFLLRQEGSRSDVIDTYGYGLTHWPAIYGHLKVLEVLHAHNINMDFRNRQGETALHLAMGNVFSNEHKRHSEVVRLLLSFGADPNARDNSGMTPIFRGVSLVGQASAVKALLEDDRTSINAQYKNGNTPLHFAVGDGSVAWVRMLLEHGADPTIRNAQGQRPIDYIQFFNKVSGRQDKEAITAEMRSVLDTSNSRELR